MDARQCYQGMESHSSTADQETVSELIARLQGSTENTEPVEIYFTSNPNINPAIVEKHALCSISEWFIRAVQQQEEDEEELAFHFTDATPDTIKLFLYWLTTHRIAKLEDLDSIPNATSTHTRSDYQLLLARTYLFAEDKQIPNLQNDAIESFVSSLWDTDLTLERLQKILRMAPRESKIRLAVLEEALWLEENEGFELLEGLDLTYLFGIAHDVRCAKAAYDRRLKARGKGADYLVKVPEEAGK